MGYDFDDIARRVESYFRKTGYNPRQNYECPYKMTKDWFIDSTMSCDPYEVIQYAKTFMSRIIRTGSTEADRHVAYADYLAVYDIYKKVKASV